MVLPISAKARWSWRRDEATRRAMSSSERSEANSSSTMATASSKRLDAVADGGGSLCGHADLRSRLARLDELSSRHQCQYGASALGRRQSTDVQVAASGRVRVPLATNVASARNEITEVRDDAGSRRDEHGGPHRRARPHAAPGGRQMPERKVGAAVVIDPESAGPGHPHRARHPRLGRRWPGPRPGVRRRPPDLRARLRRARTGRSSRRPPRWSRAASATSIVVDGGEIAGVLSVRDIVRCWTDDGASCEVPQTAASG